MGLLTQSAARFVRLLRVKLPFFGVCSATLRMAFTAHRGAISKYHEKCGAVTVFPCVLRHHRTFALRAQVWHILSAPLQRRCDGQMDPPSFSRTLALKGTNAVLTFDRVPSYV